MKSEKHNPPKYALHFFRWYCHPRMQDYIEGDLMEVYEARKAKSGKVKADLRFIVDVLLLFRPGIIKPTEGYQELNNYGMFKNCFKVSIRGLMKNPLNSFINIIGLACAIGIAVFVFAFAQWTYSTDQFHEYKNSVYLTTFFADRDGIAKQYGQTPRPMGEMLRQDFSQIKKVCRVDDRNVVIKHGDKVFHERVRLTDPEFLEMFTFPLNLGASSSLADVSSVILSDEMAIKYFGEENPVGQSILIKFSEDQGKEFKVTGVAKKFPDASTITFDFLININNFLTIDTAYDFHDWNAYVNATFIQVENPNDISSIVRATDKYRELQNKAVAEDWAITSFVFEPLATLTNRSEFIQDDISYSSGNNHRSILYLSIVAILMLTLACLNYINIAIVSAAKRLKEIGVRKSIGATRKVVIVQFLAENGVITCFALILGVALAMVVFIPGFEGMWNFNMEFSLLDAQLWIYLPLILFVTSIASGIYPSVYISRFQVVGILKGSVRFGRKNPLTKIFLGLQLVLACIFITSAVMFSMNSAYLAKRGWGYNQTGVMYSVVSDYKAFEELRSLIEQNPNVLSVSGSGQHLGMKHMTTVIHFPDHQYEVDQLAVDATYFETMGLELLKGRPFNDDEGSDRRAVIVNELLVKNMGWENPIGQQFKMENASFEVIGVVKDFHSHSFSKPLKPALFRVAEKEEYHYLSAKVKSGSEVETYKSLQASWSKLFPETPFEGGYQEDVWGGYFEEIKIHGLVWRVIALIAIILASLGLYGLMTLDVAGRIREFSIRKVLGAGLKNITTTITNQYMILFAVALSIGAPISYVVIKFFIESAYAYHMPVDYTGVGIAVIILIAVLLITMSTQVNKVVKSNPVDGLKVE
ncbi:MAG: ABC transporter permease [Cyclobacteriaceae bacterium]|nr:ABC transporter permease [Cyclobacteriaceae bacterium]